MAPFADIYQRLNTEQKLAVDTVEGPVMVLAGPGTGKTQVLAVRVANILKKTQARPSNILCLTFSNAGAVAMRERLRDLIGADAYAVTVETVHEFCGRIIRRHTAAFSEWTEMDILSDLERYKILESLIDSISHTSPLINPKDPYSRIADILQRISDCKREGKTQAELEKVADLYEKEMAEKSREGTKADQKNRQQAQKFRDFVELFKKYQETIAGRGLYDYDDMILTVLEAFKEEEWLLQGLQERYHYVLVDEAQDLNGAQWKVIEALTTYENVPHDPNFFVVGDDDQSIYRFQGANTAHLLSFRERFPKAPIIVLTKSYRSTQSIVDAAGRLIARNDDRLVKKVEGLTKNLTAVTKDKGTPPTLIRTPSDAAEPWVLAELIHERMKEGTEASEISVLVQTNRELRPLYDVLVSRGIPVVLNGKADLLTHPVVLQGLTVLRYLRSGTDDALLHALGCAALQCHPADLARIASTARTQKMTATDIVLSLEKQQGDFVDAVSLTNARDILFRLKAEEPSTALLQTVENVLRECGIVSATLDPLDLAAVECFFHYVRDLSLRSPALTLSSFLRDIDLYADEAYARVRLTYQLPHLVTSGVQLMTAHQSKGLEFNTVYLMDFRDGQWDERRGQTGMAFPEELLFGWVPAARRAEKHEDERRVTYVAMTRAKRSLVFLCPKEFSVGERTRPVAPSAFFAEAGPIVETERALQEAKNLSVLLHQPHREIDKDLAAYIEEKLNTFALSPTALTQFLMSPTDFLRFILLDQPQALTEASLRTLGYGSAVHWALKRWAEGARDKSLLSADELLGHFNWYLEHRTILTPLQRRDLSAKAAAELPRYFDAHLDGYSMHLHALEQEYRGHLGDIPLKGKIDRIDRASDTSASAIVIDYKTGAPKSDNAIRGGVEPGKISWGSEGDLFRQLVFYSLLLDQAEPLLKTERFVLEFVGDRTDEPVRREFQILESEKEDLKRLIRTVWVKIVAQDFTPLRSDFEGKAPIDGSLARENKEDGQEKPKVKKPTKKLTKKA